MPQRPTSLNQAQQWAGAVARLFDNYECAECAAAVLKAIGPYPQAAVVRLTTADGSSVVGLRDADKRISVTGIHVGVRLGDRVYDNHHPGGIAGAEWAGQFLAGTDTALIFSSKAAAELFGRIFRRKLFDQFVLGGTVEG